MEWFKDNWMTLLALGIVIVGVAVVMIVAHVLAKKDENTRTSTRDITFGAVCLATSFVLSLFGFELPQGGKITPASVLPVMLYCHYCGLKKSSVVVIAFTLLQFMQNPYILTPFQVILDYFVPYLALIFVAMIPFNRDKYAELAGLGKSTMRSHAGFYIGAGAYIIVRYVSHVLSGAIFFAEYAWAGWGAWPYSIVYNLFSVLDMAIAVGIGAALFSYNAFNTLMVKSFNAKKNADTAAKND